MSGPTWVLFVVLAAAGACLRYAVDLTISDRTGGLFPWGTFAINASGSFLLGVLTGLALYHGLPAAPKLVLGTAFCGAFTTFSTFTFETVRLAEEGATAQALTNVGLTLVTGAAAAAVGLAVTAW